MAHKNTEMILKDLVRWFQCNQRFLKQACLINADAMFHYLEQVEQSLYPCLIVLDNTLPKLNATDILSWLKSNVRYQKIPVVIYSTVLSDPLKKQLISAGVYACFEKGNSMQQIMDTAKTLKALAKGVRENS